MEKLRVANQKNTKEGANITNLFDNKDSKTVAMSIADTEFIFDVLTDISRNPYNYVVRECFSNAYDATIKAKTNKPIELKIIDNQASNTMAEKAMEYCASTIDCIFTVSDHGVGMSPDDVKKYFLQYGGSKKRVTGDIDAIGSKGLGAKAPLAITDSFAIKTTKDGITTEVIIYKTNEGYNKADMSSVTTNDESGTTIYIPIQKSHVGSIEVAIQKLCPIHVNATFNGNNLVAIPFTFDKYKRSLIKSGNVTKDGYMCLGTRSIENSEITLWIKPEYIYNIKRQYEFNIGGSFYENEPYAHNAVYVDMPAGFLNFTPSRDDIKQDAQYKRIISLLDTWIADEFKTIVHNKQIVLDNIETFIDDLIITKMSDNNYEFCLQPPYPLSISNTNVIKIADDDLKVAKNKNLSYLLRVIKMAYNMATPERLDFAYNESGDFRDFIYGILKLIIARSNGTIDTLYIGTGNASKMNRFVKSKNNTLFMLCDNENIDLSPLIDFAKDAPFDIISEKDDPKFAKQCTKSLGHTVKTYKKCDVHTFTRKRWNTETRALSTARKYENVAILTDSRFTFNTPITLCKYWFENEYHCTIDTIYVYDNSASENEAKYVKAYAEKHNIPYANRNDIKFDTIDVKAILRGQAQPFADKAKERQFINNCNKTTSVLYTLRTHNATYVLDMCYKYTKLPSILTTCAEMCTTIPELISDEIISYLKRSENNSLTKDERKWVESFNKAQRDVTFYYDEDDVTYKIKVDTIVSLMNYYYKIK